MTQTAIVTKRLDGARAEVAVERISACGHSCASCGGCADRKLITVVARDPFGVDVGARVVIATGTGRVLSAALLVYMLPLLFFFFGYVLSGALRLTETGSILLSVGAFLLGVVAVVGANRWIRRDRTMEFVITGLAEGQE